MKIVIKRFCFFPGDAHTQSGTFGALEVDGIRAGYTVEQPWNDNLPYESCVPDGVYKLIPHVSHKYGNCFIVVNPAIGVYAHETDRMASDDRFMCLFAHRGNYPDNFSGCIGIGEKLAFNGDQMMVTNTRKTVKKIMDSISPSIHELTITGCLS